MSDILIVRRRNWAHIRGMSKLGHVWIIENMTGVEVKVEIGVELAEDVAHDLRKAGLSVEVK